MIRELHETAPLAKTPREKWDNLLSKMEAGKDDDPDVRDALEKAKPLMEKIQQVLEEPQTDGPSVIDV